jgi:ankyrin repeat protein
MSAAREGCTEAVDILLTSGADVSAKNSGGNTALSLSRDSSVRELLKQAGAEE